MLVTVQEAAGLAEDPTAVLYSAKPLALREPGVQQATCTEAGGAYTTRYTGLKFVLQSGDQYFLLPSGWTQTNGTAVVLGRSPDLRLEFVPATPTGQRPPTCG